MRHSKWRVTKFTGVGEWWAYRRYTDELIPHVIPRTAAPFITWREAMNWALTDSRRPHA